MRRSQFARHLLGPIVFLATNLWLSGSPGAGAQQTEDKDLRRAGDVYRNLEVYANESVWRVDRNMKVFNVSLGVECAHCHVNDDWASEEAERKDVARHEIGMMGALRREHFRELSGPTCWTCHRGEPVPPQFAPADGLSVPLPEPSPFVDSRQPSAEIYRNIRVLKGLPAATLAPVMQFFRQALGVECSHCHVTGEWASDEKEPKRTARKMLDMVQWVKDGYFDKGKGPSCWTCHRGSNKPEINPPM